MQDVSYEPWMLCPSENPQASLDIFRRPHHHPAGSCIHRKAINKDKPTHPLAYCYITRAKWFIPVYRLGEDGDLL